MTRTLTSAIALAAAILLGCYNVQEQGAELNADAFAKKIKKDKLAILIDLRTPQEFNAGHIPGAMLIDYYGDDFRSRIESLDKSKHYYLYCRSGNRSGKAMKIMAEMGFKHVAHLSGGINTWKGRTLRGR